MRPILYAFLVTIFLAIIPAHARLDETEDQCVARYGSVVSRTTINGLGGMTLPVLQFIKNGYEIGVLLLNGKAGMITVRKQDHSAITDDEISLLLDADSAGLKWTKQPDTSPSSTWWRRDDDAGAQYDLLGGGLIFYSHDYLVAEQKSQQTEDHKNLQGF